MEKILEFIEKKLKDKYPSTTEGNKLVFRSQESSFSVCKMGEESPWNFFVIEYDDGEDGDAFYPEDYINLEDMVEDMVKEIEG